MKLLTAFIRPEALHDVKENLFAQEIYSMSITNVLGAGQQKGYTEVYRGVITEVNLLKKLRIEIGICDEKLEVAMQAVLSGARTGQEGDGVVFVTDVVQGVRIRTGGQL